MDPVSLLLSLPAELEVWLILGYVAVVLAGARLAEALARVHFEGHGAMPSGASSTTRTPTITAARRASGSLCTWSSRRTVWPSTGRRRRCNGCPLKASCTPHDEGRHLYRSLAAWAETDVGRFHRRLSLLMFGVGAVFSLGGLARWMGQPGTGLLLLALAVSLACVARDLHKPGRGPSRTSTYAD